MAKAPKVQPDLPQAYDLENPPQYKSSDSENVYTVIAQRTVPNTEQTAMDHQEIGLCLTANGNKLEIRFAVFADSQPELTVFNFRRGSKKFKKFPPTPDAEPVLRVGCSLDLVTMNVVQRLKASPMDIMAVMEQEEAWDKLGTWITNALVADKFELCMTGAELVKLLPDLLIGIGIGAPVPAIVWPEPLKKYEPPETKIMGQPVKAKVVVHDSEYLGPTPDDDGEFGEDDN